MSEPSKVWVVLGTEDDGEFGRPYVSAVFDTEPKAVAHANTIWGGTVQDFEVQWGSSDE